MKIYKVGGCVRDFLLGIEPKDNDYVVVGSTPEEMLSLGFKQVGTNGFPIYLHPETNEEYALARKEIKDGVGYNGFKFSFDPSITLEEDLFRRDLTCNAVCIDVETGHIIDPYNGIQDIIQKRIRAVSEHFSEDPIRILRACRLAARLDWQLDVFPELEKAVEGKDILNVPNERIRLEFEKAFSDKNPHKFIVNICKSDVIFDLFEEKYHNSIHNAIRYGTFDTHFNDISESELDIKFYFANILFCLIDDDRDDTDEYIQDLLDSNKLHLTNEEKQLIKDIRMFEHLDTYNAVDYVSSIENLKCNKERFNNILLWQASYVLPDREIKRHWNVFNMVTNITFSSLSEEQQKTLKGSDISLAIHLKRVEVLENFIESTYK